MILHSHFEPDAAFEFGRLTKRSRVDPAKTLDLIRRIQSAGGPASTGLPKPAQTPQPLVRAG